MKNIFFKNGAYSIMLKIAFLGAGNMASAIIRSLTACEICIFDKNPSQYDKFKGAYRIAASAADAVDYADYVFLSVKPQNFPELLTEIAESGVVYRQKLFISIGAGVPIARICSFLGDETPVIRTMPNTPLMIGCGTTALTRNTYVSDDDFIRVQQLFALSGSTLVLPESKMNAIVSVTSSSPAYIYLMIKAIADSADAQGLDIPNMTDLICDMVIGSAQMIKQSGKTPDELIAMVKSPNGTTEQALNVFEEAGFTDIIARAMDACTRRAEELSK